MNKQRNITIWLLCLILVFGANLSFAKDSFKQIVSFESFEGNMTIKENGTINVYLNLGEFIELHAKKKFKNKFPSWNGESYYVHSYKWNKKDKKYLLNKEYFDNLSLDKVTNNNINTLNVSNKPWAKVLQEKTEVKAYKVCDINNDQKDEVIIFSRRKINNYKNPAKLSVLSSKQNNFRTIAILEPKDNYSYKDWGPFSNLVDFKVEDINRDGFLEIIILSVSAGGSGYTISLDIFAKDVGQDSVKENIKLN